MNISLINLYGMVATDNKHNIKTILVIIGLFKLLINLFTTLFIFSIDKRQYGIATVTIENKNFTNKFLSIISRLNILVAIKKTYKINSEILTNK